MASEQGESASLPGGIEKWLADHTDDTGEDRADVLARAVASYRLLTEEADGDQPLESTLSELESRIESLEADNGTDADSDRIEELEAELDGHVEDLRSRIVDVVKEARSRAPVNHSHEGLETRVDEQAETTDELADSLDELATEIEQFEESVETRFEGLEDELDPLSESVSDLESKATKLAGAVVDMRRRLQRVESHVSHQTALAKLLQTAAREDISKARCDNCNETVELGLLVEPICPHCRSVFDGIEPGSLFFKSAWLTIADRPALEAGETTEEPFDVNKTAAGSKPHQDTQ